MGAIAAAPMTGGASLVAGTGIIMGKYNFCAC